MSSEYYAPGPDRAEKVRQLFGRIARRYDLINDLQSFGLHRLWKRKVARLALARNGTRALDLCCGTGDIGRLLSARGLQTIGCDFSGEMIAAAPRRNRVQQFARGDALSLPFRDSKFDLVTVAYGLRNLADLERGLREIRRVSKPGAPVLILDFGRPSHRLWRAFYFAYLRAVVPIFGSMFAGDAAAYRYILESLEHYPAQDGVAALLHRLQFRDVEVHNLLGGMMSIHAASAPLIEPAPRCSAAIG
jgi:demethylmenaquinone methyltransferase/2-methoxy-6-polyprenyl-1,4-benzoquinol methylase